QVELDVTPAPVELEGALALAERSVFSSFDQGKVGVEKASADGAHHAEGEFEVAVGEVVEEDAADAARLVAMLEMEVLVAPELEARVVVEAERDEGFLALAVDVPCVR